jgi:hypothetical protein
MIRRRTIALALAVLIVVAVGLAAAQEPGASGPNEEQKRNSLRQVTGLFIITLVVLVVMFSAMVILSIVMRRRRIQIMQQRPEMPTELEDLWWRMNREDDADKKE